MISETEIRERLTRMLISSSFAAVEDFQDWLVQTSWNMQLDSTQEAQNLVSALELAFSEHSSGHLSDIELIERLSSIRSGSA